MGLLLAGDRRANENHMLLSLHAALVLEHNRVARWLARLLPPPDGLQEWPDQALFERAQRLVRATVQRITFSEWLPLLTGRHLPRAYAGFNATAVGYARAEAVAALSLLARSRTPASALRLRPDGSFSASGPIDVAARMFEPLRLMEEAEAALDAPSEQVRDPEGVDQERARPGFTWAPLLRGMVVS